MNVGSHVRASAANGMWWLLSGDLGTLLVVTVTCENKMIALEPSKDFTDPFGCCLLRASIILSLGKVFFHAIMISFFLFSFLSIYLILFARQSYTHERRKTREADLPSADTLAEWQQWAEASSKSPMWLEEPKHLGQLLLLS